MEVEEPGRSTDWRELVAVVLLSVTAIATAWTGFQASKWGGAMSISFSQASSARIEANRQQTIANRMQTIQVGVFGQWLQAYSSGDDRLADFLQARFPAPLDAAFPVWLESKPLKNPDASPTPFDLPEYRLEPLEKAAASDARADAKFAEALRDNQRGDNYTVLTIAFATVLFFAALSGRMRSTRAQWGLLAIGGAGFIASAIVLLSLPKLV